ncbi:MAG: efflux RND transporter periplasmic adaptor subunit [Pseudomonadota bacterium]
MAAVSRDGELGETATQTLDERPPIHGRLGWLWAAFGFIIFGLGAAVFYAVSFLGIGQSEPASTRSSPLELVAVVPIREIDEPLQITQTGFIRPTSQVSVASEVNGRLARVSSSFDVGRRVAKDEQLFAIDPDRLEADVAQARAEVAQAEAQLRQGRSNLDRQRTLSRRNVVAEATLEDAQVTVARNEAQLQLAQAALRKAEIARGDATVSAPFDAFVTEATASIGQLVQAGQSLGTLVRADKAEVFVGLADNARALLPDDVRLIGTTVEVRRPVSAVDQNARPQTSAESRPARSGYVSAIEPRIDVATRTTNLVVTIDRPFDLSASTGPLRVNELVEVSIPFRQDNLTLLAAPLTALQADGRVWSVSSDQRLQAVTPQYVRRRPDQLQFATSALQGGSEVVVSALTTPEEGRKVRVARANPERSSQRLNARDPADQPPNDDASKAKSAPEADADDKARL